MILKFIGRIGLYEKFQNLNYCIIKLQKPPRVKLG